MCHFLTNHSKNDSPLADTMSFIPLVQSLTKDTIKENHTGIVNNFKRNKPAKLLGVCSKNYNFIKL
jgi:hypothetical protein